MSSWKDKSGQLYLGVAEGHIFTIELLTTNERSVGSTTNAVICLTWWHISRLRELFYR